MLTAEQQLGIAVSLASQGHEGQFDKSGKPYILHPLHLMQQLLFDLELATIAVLHDYFEDCDGITIDQLADMGFSERVVAALRLLTHDPKDSYEEYIQRISTNYDATRVKRKDLEHNSCITRLKGLRPKDIARVNKYQKAFQFLGEAKKAFQ